MFRSSLDNKQSQSYDVAAIYGREHVLQQYEDLSAKRQGLLSNANAFPEVVEQVWPSLCG
jgi:hypothetical protein